MSDFYLNICRMPTCLCVLVLCISLGSDASEESEVQPSEIGIPTTEHVPGRIPWETCRQRIEELLELDGPDRAAEVDLLNMGECRQLAYLVIGLNADGARNSFYGSRERQRRVGSKRRLIDLEHLLGKRLYILEQERLRRENETPQGPETIELLAFDPFEYPRVDGSTSAWPLGRLIACRLLNAPYTWTAIPAYRRSERETGDLSYLFARRNLEARVEPREYERVGRMINESLVIHRGTHSAYDGLIEGRADFILVAREPSRDELDDAGETELDVRRIAHDALVFIVNAENPVESLTTQQIIDIYTGRIRGWSQVGGENAPITPYRRNSNSGSQELMDQYVMKGRPFGAFPGNRYETDLIGMGMGDPFHQMIRDKAGIGFSVYFYEHFMSVSPITKVIAVDGIRPTRENIADNSYPFITGVYAVIRKNLPDDHPARKLRDWLQTEEGQAVIGESGYVPVSAGH